MRWSPTTRFLTVGALIALGLTLGLALGARVVAWLAYLIAINAVTAGFFGYDKWMAGRLERGEPGRIPENTLLLLSLVGGSAGGLVSSQALRHKTRKHPFRLYLWLIVGLHLASVIALLLLR